MIKRKIHHYIFAILLALALYGVYSISDLKSLNDFKDNVVSAPLKEIPAFDGTIMPIQSIPDWLNLTNGDFNNRFEKIPQDKLVSIPEYNPEILQTPLSKLDRNKDKEAILAKMTYLVAYMGDYKLDQTDLIRRENIGGHLAVDINTLKGTPVYAIGNGIVVKVNDDEAGFGKHIVIKHPNFPSFDDENKKVTYYSNYAHLDNIFVSEGQIVTKGNKIGETGQTGLASMPHLHFQIDTDSAPFHPYWPFTFQEAYNAGYDFIQAINAGLGKENAIENTINPLLYIQKYSNKPSERAKIALRLSSQLTSESNLHGSAVKKIKPSVKRKEVIKRVKAIRRKTGSGK